VVHSIQPVVTFLMTFLFSALLLFSGSAHAWTTYTVPHTDGADDIPALVSALSSSSSSNANVANSITKNASIVFKKGVTYNAWSAIMFPVLENVEIVFEGNVSYPEDIASVQAVVGASVSLALH
jgi:hypothetical protein